MKNIKIDFSQITNFHNLLNAFYKARKRKRKEPKVVQYYINLEKNLFELKKELDEKSYFPSDYRIFYVQEHKKRLIAAAEFKDRIVHHAILNIIEPFYEKTFIFDSYGCRRGKGQHKAVKRFQNFAKKNRFVLKIDIEKFYASIDHEILKESIKKKICDIDTIELIDKIIDSGRKLSDSETGLIWFKNDDLFTPIERFKGLPIGNVTSQFFANVYLNSLDWFVKQKCKCKYYLRYMDDIAIFSNEKKFLWEKLRQIEDYLDELRLVLNKGVTTIQPVSVGTEYLGYRIWPTHIKVRKSTVYRFVRKTNKKISHIKVGSVSYENIKDSYIAWNGHIMHANGYNLKKSVGIRLLNNNLSIKSELLKKCFKDI